MPLTEALRAKLSDLVASQRVLLFMKGTPETPQCGFSAQVVKILGELGASYEAIDVLTSSELRDGIKEFSQWPTIPQLYVDGQFIGGCDIVRELDASGELRKLIGAGPFVPGVEVTEAASAAFKEYLADSRGDRLRLHVDPQFQHDLFLGPPEPRDISVDIGGLTLVVDASSARRAHGVKIDFVGGEAGGFKIHNPNEPRRVQSLSPEGLKAAFERGEPMELFDVRTAVERTIAKLDRARPLDDEGERYLLSLDRAAPIVFHCHHGMRSRTAAEQAVQAGFKNVYNLEGGIDAWSLTVDSSVPRY